MMKGKVDSDEETLVKAVAGNDHVAVQLTNDAADDRLHRGEASSSAPAGASPPKPKESTLPLPQSLGLAAAYIFTSIFYFISIRYTKKLSAETGRSYNNSMVVFCSELTKLSISVLLKYLEDGEMLVHTVFFSPRRRAMWRGGLPYAVPSFLYAVYNNLTFVNLNRFDPGTYQVFMQLRILFTGFLFTLLLKQALTVRKWCGLVLLMVGVASKYYFASASLQLDGYVVFMLLQGLLSSLAGVYNEYALKKEMNLSIHQQNFFMYFYAIFFNAVFGLATMMMTSGMDASSATAVPQAEPGTPLTTVSTFSYYFSIGLVVFFAASTGLCAAFILKFINVIVKAFAAAVEVLLTAVLAYLLLGEDLHGYDVVAAAIVMASVYVYYTQGRGDKQYVTCCMGK